MTGLELEAVQAEALAIVEGRLSAYRKDSDRLQGLAGLLAGLLAGMQVATVLTLRCDLKAYFARKIAEARELEKARETSPVLGRQLRVFETLSSFVSRGAHTR